MALCWAHGVRGRGTGRWLCVGVAAPRLSGPFAGRPRPREGIGEPTSTSRCRWPRFFALAWLVMWPRVGGAWNRRSPFAFYVLATLGMRVLALGPTARLLGSGCSTRRPTRWLMALPGSPTRVPRAGTLRDAGGAHAQLSRPRWAIGRLTEGLGPRGPSATYPDGGRGRWLADGWIEPLPLPAPPPPNGRRRRASRKTSSCSSCRSAPSKTWRRCTEDGAWPSPGQRLQRLRAAPLHGAVHALADGQIAVLGALGPRP